MLRKLHSYLGLAASILVVLLAISGAVLAINPALDRAQAKVSGTDQISVADVAANIARFYPNVEQLQRKASGGLIVYYSNANKAGADLVDPFTGEKIAAYSLSPFKRWVQNFHRSFLLDTPGRAAGGIGALLMVVLSISGLFMLRTRQGGWRKIFRSMPGSIKQDLHGHFSRFAVLGLVLSAITGGYMSANRFELIPVYQQVDPAFPETVNGGKPAAVDALPALQDIAFSDLRELVYPYAGDIRDVYSLRTDQGVGFIDQATGELLSYQMYGTPQKIYEFIYMLHTGEGLWWLALLVGLASFSVPLLAVTGLQIFMKRRRSIIRIKNNATANSADIVILVGSESNSTWGFAKTLHDALSLSGYRVHSNSMNNIASTYPKAKQMFILTSTYGDGDAPASAKLFMNKIKRFANNPNFQFCVLGFGDRTFDSYGQFALDVNNVLLNKGWNPLTNIDIIDKQSTQAFNRWGTVVGSLMGLDLDLIYCPVHLNTQLLQLVDRVDYGAEVNAPTAILRFIPAEKKTATFFNKIRRKPRLPQFSAGDLVGILPTESDGARFYSLASASKNRQLEICVHQHPQGICSNYLHKLQLGECIKGFIRENPTFRPRLEQSSIILIGAGTGIAPLIGFIRNNHTCHPMRLYWGGRDPNSDFLYRAELEQYLQDKRLTELVTAFSRTEESCYVQDKVLADAPKIQALISEGAQILVCGGRPMSKCVAAAITRVISPLQITLQDLKEQGRYLEDVY
ncbi:oxidoreductase FAD/NAD(P)-binding domain protein [Psychromonas ingrahamii 37]|uniref:Oxidoreductase FAD/NAD(P)-binding domain protein n=1 Tax=Psychromonas ingrahamii (strain DSM 17664 / CCUG 51855 / 37) TaxID=357804 RepID=A1SRM3_PSYIN|nr:PepSY domain-containing protein [Psychromonas ingrahamii]ABM02138.1 oxidoreductase FAD/NAD(P)-binding domain protein [Psychromonas ingrahamii 37]